MNEILIEKVAWQRRSARLPYVGTVQACENGIRLTGREPTSGLEVSLSIPLDEVERVHVSESPHEGLTGEQSVVVELAGSDAILIRRAGAEPLYAQSLARRLDTLADEAHLPLVRVSR